MARVRPSRFLRSTTDTGFSVPNTRCQFPNACRRPALTPDAFRRRHDHGCRRRKHVDDEDLDRSPLAEHKWPHLIDPSLDSGSSVVSLPQPKTSSGTFCALSGCPKDECALSWGRDAIVVDCRCSWVGVESHMDSGADYERLQVWSPSTPMSIPMGQDMWRNEEREEGRSLEVFEPLIVAFFEGQRRRWIKRRC